MLNNYDIERGFLKKEDIDKLLYDFKTRVSIMEDMQLDSKARIKMIKGINQTVATRLRIAFQRQIQLDEKESLVYYNAHIEQLRERIDIFYYILEYLNDIDITYIPDKLTTCSFFRVSADTFDFLLKDAQVDVDVQKEFNAINEFILSLTQIGLETGALNNYAWNRLQLKNKYGGHEIAKPETSDSKTTLVISGDIQRKLANDYDFTKMIEEKEKKED